LTSTTVAMPWFHHIFGAGPTASGRAAAAPRLTRHAFRFLSRDQQLSQDLKMPTQDPQPHVPTVAAEGLISAPIQTIARLQRANCRLDPRMTPPCLAEFHGGLLLLTLGLNVACLGQARLLYQFHAIRQFAYYREGAAGRLKEDRLRDYLLLLSISQTCRYRGVSFLRFLLSRERDIDAFCEKPRRRRRFRIIEVYPKGIERTDSRPRTRTASKPESQGQEEKHADG
jgi:hypothetical protein